MQQMTQAEKNYREAGRLKQESVQHEEMRKKNEEEAEARKMRTLEAQAQSARRPASQIERGET